MLKTTDDYRTWAIDGNHEAPEELLEYVKEISDWNDSEVKIILINMIDKVVAVNGLPAFSSDSAWKASFIETVAPFEYNSDNNRVSFVNYYSDRDIAEVMYDAHPLDPHPRNTKHSGEELQALFKSIFTWWKSNIIENISYQITDPSTAQPTFD